MMNKIVLCLVLLPLVLKSQSKVYFSVNTGGTVLTHRANLETTTYNNLYRAVALFAPDPEKVTFEDFKRVYNINTDVYQPKFSANLVFAPENLPLAAGVEISTSPSTLTAPRLALSFGFSDRFYFGENWYISFFSGYSFAKDWGWGTATLLNSMHNKEARGYAREWFAANEDLGINQAGMITISASVGFMLLQNYSLELKPFYEIDVSGYIKKPARMTNFGAVISIVTNINNIGS